MDDRILGTVDEESEETAGPLPSGITVTHAEEDGPDPGSLAARVKARAEELESTISAVFPIPNWDDILAVELRLVGWEPLRRVVAKHERHRVPAMRELYTAADQMLIGTVRFFEIDEQGRRHPAPEDYDWITLARATGKNLPQALTPRQAIISLMGDTNVAILWQQWQEWMTTRRPEVDEEVARDFGTTQ